VIGGLIGAGLVGAPLFLLVLHFMKKATIAEERCKFHETALKEIRKAMDARRSVSDSPDSLRRDPYNRDGV
jgi:hypothetical protein